ALYLYYQHQVGKAFLSLADFAFQHNARAGYDDYLLGVWALEQGAYQVAKQYWERSQQGKVGSSSLAAAVVSEVTGDTAQAAAYWRLFAEEESPEQQKLAVLYSKRNSADLSGGSAADSLTFLNQFLSPVNNTSELIEWTQRLKEGDFKWQVALDVIQKVLNQQQHERLPDLFVLLENK